MSHELEYVSSTIRQHDELVHDVGRQHAAEIAMVGCVLINCATQKGTIYWCGNGGSAADSQHLAAELIGRFKRERRAIASIALTTDTSILTAIGNDYGYREIFSRQVEGLVRKGDVIVGMSTSGNSENVILAIRAAKAQGATAVGLLGRDGGLLKKECDYSLVVPSLDTARIQEMHIMIGHILCDLVEQACTSNV